MPADVLERQADQLARDYRALQGDLAAQARAELDKPGWQGVRQIYMVGTGDSLSAGLAAQLAFETIAGVTCIPYGAQAFADYALASCRLQQGADDVAVVACSASGRTPEAVAAVAAARELGVHTLAITGDPAGRIAAAADGTLTAELVGQERSPGIRSYQATLLGLLNLAVELGAVTGRARPGVARLAAELSSLAGAIEETTRLARRAAGEAAALIQAAPTALMLGTGPGFGTARFAAAKITEGLGLVAAAQDLDEWWHIERFVQSPEVPMFLIAPPGRSALTALRVALAGRQLGRRVVVVSEAANQPLVSQADFVLPVSGQVTEEFSALLYHIFAGYLVAAMSASRRYVFDDRPADLPRTLDGFTAGPENWQMEG